MARRTGMTSEEFRRMLTEIVRLAGEEIADRAPDIVGDGDMISGLRIIVTIEEPVQAPTIEIERTHLCRKILDAKMNGSL